MKERQILVLDLPKTWISTTSDLSDKEFRVKWLVKYQKQNRSLKDEQSKKEKALNKKYL